MDSNERLMLYEIPSWWGVMIQVLLCSNDYLSPRTRLLVRKGKLCIVSKTTIWKNILSLLDREEHALICGLVSVVVGKLLSKVFS